MHPDNDLALPDLVGRAILCVQAHQPPKLHPPATAQQKARLLRRAQSATPLITG